MLKFHFILKGKHKINKQLHKQRNEGVSNHKIQSTDE